MEGLCECGCGQKTTLILKSDKRRGTIKGQPCRFIKFHHNKMVHKGESHPSWKGGKFFDKSGYVMVRMPEHKRQEGRRYVREHIIIAEKMLGRELLDNEVVHHINGDKADNSVGNLKICSSKAEHMKIHEIERATAATGDNTMRKCKFCKKWDSLSNLFRSNNKAGNYHKKCHAVYEKERRNAKKILL